MYSFRVNQIKIWHSLRKNKTCYIHNRQILRSYSTRTIKEFTLWIKNKQSQGKINFLCAFLITTASQHFGVCESARQVHQKNNSTIIVELDEQSLDKAVRQTKVYNFPISVIDFCRMSHCFDWYSRQNFQRLSIAPISALAWGCLKFFCCSFK